MTKPLKTQVGGSHYKDMPIQVVEFCHKNKIGYIEGCVIKYMCRWKRKGGLEDLQKAKHYIEMLIEMEEKENENSNKCPSSIESVRKSLLL